MVKGQFQNAANFALLRNPPRRRLHFLSLCEPQCQKASMLLNLLRLDSAVFSKNTLRVLLSSRNSCKMLMTPERPQLCVVFFCFYNIQCYTIDTKTYPAEHLVDASLGEYQRPALLVYNNRTFSDDDFGSLKKLGDSQKATDKLTTGKFGLGFSSVHLKVLIGLIIGLWLD